MTMKKACLTKILCSVFICAVACNDLLATDVSGTIVNQTWTSNNSPYRVVGDILVAGLTINPGVTVQVASNYAFEVAGVLKANGSATAPIVFMRTNGGWQGIYFNHSSPGSYLNYCIISNSVNSGIRVVDTKPAIANCVIANNSAANGGGIYASSVSIGGPVLQSCLVTNNTASGEGGGIYANMAVGDLLMLDCDILNNISAVNGGGLRVVLGTNNVLRMDGCRIVGNVANPAGNRGNYLGGGLFVTGFSLLRNCVLNANTCKAASSLFENYIAQGGAIALESGVADLKNCVVSGNQAVGIDACSTCCCHSFSAFGGGIFIVSGSLSMANSIVSSNIVSSSSSQLGGGVCFNNTGTSANIVNCTIAYNNAEGIYTDGTGVQMLNSIVYFNGTQIHGATNVTYCDVQDGFTGTGNINANPIFYGTDNLIIVASSPCTDKGSTNAAYKDVLFPPSLGSSRNDIGAHGGPGAGARLRIEVWPETRVFVLGCVPGYNYLLQGSTNLSDWVTVQPFQISHVGDAISYIEPAPNTLPRRFYKLNLAP